MSTLQVEALCLSHSPVMQSKDGGAEGERFLATLGMARHMVEEMEPDLVVFFGPDHMRAFPDVVPAVAVISDAEGYGDWGTRTGRYAVDRELAASLAAELLDRGHEIAFGGPARLDHGVGQTYAQLFGDLDAVPIVPVIINCARPPLAPMAAVAELGRHVGDWLRQLDRRVLVIGSGGLSHDPPTLHVDTSTMHPEERERYVLDRLREAAEAVDADWDRAFLAMLEHGDFDRVAQLSTEFIDVAGAGAHEIRTWAAAFTATDRRAQITRYEPVLPWVTGMGFASTLAPPVAA